MGIIWTLGPDAAPWLLLAVTEDLANGHFSRRPF